MESFEWVTLVKDVGMLCLILAMWLKLNMLDNIVDINTNIINQFINRSNDKDQNQNNE
jgi:hypothetical protein